MSSNRTLQKTDLKKLKTAKLKASKQIDTKEMRLQSKQKDVANSKHDSHNSVLSLTSPSSFMPRRPRDFERQTQQQYKQHFDELVDMLIASHPTSRFTDVASNVNINSIPTLQIGFLARAMGLNVTNDQVVIITQLVQDDGPSRGMVDRQKLKGVIINALTTGVIQSSTALQPKKINSAQATIWQSNKSKHQPSTRYCIRADEEHLFRAFQTLDVKHKGYLQPEQMRLEMMSIGERFTDEEWENMRMVMVDPQTGVINYREFADFLARN